MLAFHALLCAQSLSEHQGRRFMIAGARIHEQDPIRGTYATPSEWPPLSGEGVGTGPTTICWDGALLYRLSFEEREVSQIQCGFLASPGGERPQPIWYWRPPVSVQGRVKLLGGWDGQALVAQPVAKPDSEAGATVPLGWALVLIDLADGQAREVFRQVTAKLPALQSLMREGEAFVFTSAGTAIRVDCVTKHADVITEDFWADAGFDLCRDPASAPNPRVLGRPFLNPDGGITLAVQPKVFLDEADIQRAWGRLEEPRRRELIEQGIWPTTPGRKVGWKDQACFLSFRPESRTWRVLEPSLYPTLVEQKDRNFITTEFKPEVDDSTLFMWEEGVLVPFKAPVTAHPAPAAAGAGGAPSPRRATP